MAVKQATITISAIKLLGFENIVFEKDELKETQTATFKTKQKIPLILFPATQEEVQDCLRIARQYAISVYPVSSGKNWGYGSSVPYADNCVLLNLNRMCKITNYNEKQGTICIEPGVTQGDLCVFLKKQGGKFWMDATGASPDCSIICLAKRTQQIGACRRQYPLACRRGTPPRLPMLRVHAKTPRRRCTRGRGSRRHRSSTDPPPRCGRTRNTGEACRAPV